MCFLPPKETAENSRKSSALYDFSCIPHPFSDKMKRQAGETHEKYQIGCIRFGWYITES